MLRGRSVSLRSRIGERAALRPYIGRCPAPDVPTCQRWTTSPARCDDTHRPFWGATLVPLYGAGAIVVRTRSGARATGEIFSLRNAITRYRVLAIALDARAVYVITDREGALGPRWRPQRAAS